VYYFAKPLYVCTVIVVKQYYNLPSFVSSVYVGKCAARIKLIKSTNFSNASEKMLIENAGTSVSSKFVVRLCRYTVDLKNYVHTS
jgi:hypothetical protein